jgi:hypothetical protein
VDRQTDRQKEIRLFIMLSFHMRLRVLSGVVSLCSVNVHSRIFHGCYMPFRSPILNLIFVIKCEGGANYEAHYVRDSITRLVHPLRTECSPY